MKNIATILLLLFLAVLAGCGAAGKGHGPHDGHHEHGKDVPETITVEGETYEVNQGSPVRAANGEDVSYLYGDNYSNDWILRACDNTYGVYDGNGRWTVARAYNAQSGRSLRVTDGPGGGGCATNFAEGRPNYEWHQTGTIKPFDNDWSSVVWGNVSYH